MTDVITLFLLSTESISIYLNVFPIGDVDYYVDSAIRPSFKFRYYAKMGGSITKIEIHRFFNGELDIRPDEIYQIHPELTDLFYDEEGQFYEFTATPELLESETGGNLIIDSI